MLIRIKCIGIIFFIYSVCKVYKNKIIKKKNKFYSDALALGKQQRKQQKGGLRKSMVLPLAVSDWERADRPPARCRIKETSTNRQSRK
jgi:hypothetical protein